MAGHKLTILGHPAFKKIQTYLQGQDLSELRETRRLAYADGIIAISGGSGLKLMSKYYHIDPAAMGLFERFEAMLAGYGFRNALQRPPHVCAEAHLWLTLVGRHCRHVQEKQAPRHRHAHPRHLNIWVYEIDRKKRPKEDSPCENCRQWVRKEFRTVNGTS